MASPTFSYADIHRGDLDRVRFHIGDTIEHSGPLPDDGNLSDEEILSIIVAEGTWQRAVAACFERLTASWRRFPNLESDQFGLSRSHIANGYSQDAAKWRERYGYADSPIARGAFSVGFYKVDGFSDDKIVGAADDL